MGAIAQQLRSMISGKSVIRRVPSSLDNKFSQSPERPFTPLATTRTSTVPIADKSVMPRELARGARGLARFAKPLIKEPKRTLETAEAGLRAGFLQSASAVETMISKGFEKFATFKGADTLLGSHAVNDYLTVSAKLMQQAKVDRELSQYGLKVENDKEFREAIKDPFFVVQGVFQNIPNTLTALGVGAVGGQ